MPEGLFNVDNGLVSTPSKKTPAPAPAARPPGRPRITLDPATVTDYAARGFTLEQIADGAGASKGTLRERIQNDPEIREAYKVGRFQAQATALAELNSHAEKWGPASIFKVKNLLDWKDRPAESISGEIRITIERQILGETVSPAREGAGVIDVTPEIEN